MCLGSADRRWLRALLFGASVLRVVAVIEAVRYAELGGESLMQPFGVATRRWGVEFTRVPKSFSSHSRAGAWPADLLVLFEANRVEMVRLAHLLTGSNVAAEDIVQEAFVRLRRHWHRVEKPSGYLRSSVVNLARGYLRRRDVERRYSRAELADRRLTGD
jgi:hypothetical protein